LPTQPGHAPGAPGDADREARIEQLLLSGLDHYFAGEYERAIGVWTRVIFLERHHDRARAYIERARSALAERQREIDELVHTGVAAYNRGEMDQARDLLTRAAEQGSDTAHVFLDRLNRVGRTEESAGAPPVPAPRRASVVLPRIAAEPRRFRWLAAGAAAAVVGAVMLVGGLPLGTWLSDLQGADPAPVAATAVSDPLPVVRASETALDRAQALREDGRLRDALRTLDTIDLADPFRGEADRLRAEIHRELLAAAGIAPGPPGEAAISR
jgi:tetratricopeptide (TPR) repeat protein